MTNNLKQTNHHRKVSYYRFLTIALVGLPLFSSFINIVENNYQPAVINLTFAVIFGLLYLLQSQIERYYFPIVGTLFQLYIVIQSSFIVTGVYVEAALGLFVMGSPIFFRGRTLTVLFVTAAIGYHLPYFLGHYTAYYETSFLLYVCGFFLIRFVIRDRDATEQALREKQELVEQQQAEIERLNALQLKLAKKRQSEEWLHKFSETVKRDLSNPDFQIEDLTELLGVGRTQLFQRVKEATELSPNQYLMEMRLQRAKELLETNQVENVKAAQLAVGIRQSSYFAKKYKERFGLLPSESLKL